MSFTGNGSRASLPAVSSHVLHLARGWLILGICAVAASGLFSILLVLSRTPGLQDHIPWLDFFHTALIVHVDLSVLIWFLSFTAAVWSLGHASGAPAIDWLALCLAAAGTLLIALAPFAGNAHPLINNYVPVLQQGYFLAGLITFAAGFTLRVLTQLMAVVRRHDPGLVIDEVRTGNTVAAVTAAIAIGILAWSWSVVEGTGEYYYEFLFWGPGHVIQFTYTIMVLVIWIWLARLAGIRIPADPRILAALLILAGSPVIFAPVICVLAQVDSLEYRVWFTDLMIYGGLAALPLILLVAVPACTSARANEEQKTAKAALLCSLVLFAAGGLLGFLIRGVNVTIPAHYHGSIVGITIAFFGLTYYLLPMLGYRRPSPQLAVAQIYFYGAGQLLHIAGLAWSGGYGVQRKTAGAAQGLEQLPEIAGMAMMGLGGLIAIIGGILFVVLVLYCLWPERKTGVDRG